MKKVYFVQSGFKYGDSLYIPYSVGCLAANAWRDEKVKEEFEFSGILFDRPSVNEAADFLKDPFLVACSCSVWTYEYYKLLIKEVKKRYPECIIVCGGHDVPMQGGFELFEYADILIHGEGEEAFRLMLRALAENRSLKDIPNISYKFGTDEKDNNRIISNPYRETVDLSSFPSPYIEGFFDDFADSKQYSFCATIETNRGCPYDCAYCDWCSSRKIRQFPIEKIKKEIEWCAKHKIEYVFCADANFGILKRDLEIAEYVAQVKKKYGYPYVFNVCCAKESNENVFAVFKTLYENGLCKAATLAYQSANEQVLENVGRKNFTVSHFGDIAKKYAGAGIPTYTELILGLPGETKESFCRGLCSLIEAGQQNAVTVYLCQVYRNSRMGSQEYREKFGIKTQRIPMNYLHTHKPEENETVEYAEVVSETESMSHKEIAECMLFSAIVQCFHHIGLLKCFAVYLHNEKNISYYDFYSRLRMYAENNEDTLLGELYNSFCDHCSDFGGGEWTYYNEKYGKIGWYPEEGLFMELISNEERFWEETESFLRGFGIEEEIFDELFRYQKSIIRTVDRDSLEAEFEYDFYSYFSPSSLKEKTELLKRKNIIVVSSRQSVSDWKEYARQIMLYAKKRGATVMTNDRENVRVVYTD